MELIQEKKSYTEYKDKDRIILKVEGKYFVYVNGVLTGIKEKI